MYNFAKRLWHWHGIIGKLLTGFVIACFVGGLVGLALGITKCKQADEIVYTNIFLNEKFELHNSNYEVVVSSASTKDNIIIINKKGESEQISGHFLDTEIKIDQKPQSTEKPHTIDEDDFKLKGHTGVYLPLNDIASLVGWDMIDCHWDKKDNGFVISSANIKTKNAYSDYSYIGKTISPGEEVQLHVYLPITNKECNVETSIMILEIDFFIGGVRNEKNRGEDVILQNRPTSLIDN